MPPFAIMSTIRRPKRKNRAMHFPSSAASIFGSRPAPTSGVDFPRNYRLPRLFPMSRVEPTRMISMKRVAIQPFLRYDIFRAYSKTKDVDPTRKRTIPFCGGGAIQPMPMMIPLVMRKIQNLSWRLKWPSRRDLRPWIGLCPVSTRIETWSPLRAHAGSCTTKS